MEINFKEKVDKLKAGLLDSYYNTDSRDLQNKAMWQLDFLNEKVRPIVNLMTYHINELESCVAKKDRHIDDLQKQIKDLELLKEDYVKLLMETKVID